MVVPYCSFHVSQADYISWNSPPGWFCLGLAPWESRVLRKANMKLHSAGMLRAKCCGSLCTGSATSGITVLAQDGTRLMLLQIPPHLLQLLLFLGQARVSSEVKHTAPSAGYPHGQCWAMRGRWGFQVVPIFPHFMSRFSFQLLAHSDFRTTQKPRG